MENVILTVARAAMLKSQALLLSLVNPEQPRIDRRAARTRVLILDHRDQTPDLRLLPVSRKDSAAAQTPAKPNAETNLLLAGNIAGVQVVVRRRIEHAVGEDGGRQAHLLPEQQLQTASGPGIPASLQDVGDRRGHPQAPGRAAQLCPNRGEAAVQQKFQMPATEAQVPRSPAG